jgi:predicted ester cyclase/heme-degrading monooxygenase HmoA
MYVRMNMLAGDPARLGQAIHYLQATVRPRVESESGNRGLAVLTNPELGVCVIASYWDSAAAMTASEQAVEIPRKELTDMINGTVMVEAYEVAVFLRRSRPQAGAGVRMTRIDGDPGRVEMAIEEFRKRAIPALTGMAGLCSMQLLDDRGSGATIAITTWEDMGALAANRSAAAMLRTDLAAVTHTQVRMIEEYTMAFSTVREGDTRSMIERDIEQWNARDREGWLAAADLQRLEVVAPGGLHLSGRAAAETIWNMWNEAFPDNRQEIVALHADDRGGVHEGRFTGTHSGTLRSPAGEIPATGRMLDARFCAVYELDGGKITSTHLYFDQVDLLTQLGQLPGPA